MSKYVIRNGELYQVDDVVGDELRHHKYTTKYRKNGKWVYVYDEASAKQGKAKNVNLGPFHKPTVTKISTPTRNNSKFAREEDRNSSDQSKAKQGNSWNSKVNYGKRTVKKGFEKVGDWGNKAAKDVSNWGRNAIDDVGDWGKKAAKDVGNWGKKAVSDVGDYADKGLTWVGDNIFGGKKKREKKQGATKDRAAQANSKIADVRRRRKATDKKTNSMEGRRRRKVRTSGR